MSSHREQIPDGFFLQKHVKRAKIQRFTNISVSDISRKGIAIYRDFNSY